MDKAALNRLAVGFFAALAVPAIKVAQNGVNLGAVNLATVLGFMIPIVAMSAICGAYAVFIEKDETDMKRLFRMCVALPAFMTTLAGGGAPDVTVSVSEAHAGTMKQITCDPDWGLKQGMASAYSTLTDHKYKKYWLLSKDKTSGDRCVKADGKCYVIIMSVDGLRPGHLYMDKFTCKLIEVPDVQN